MRGVTSQIVKRALSATSAITLALLTSGCVSVPVRPVANAPAGQLRGVRQGDLNTWFGIRYAKPPIGSLRWKPPVPVDDATDISDVTVQSPACVQIAFRPEANPIYHEDIGPLDEDCLALNIWAPAEARNAPVLVWIHGGALVSGASHLSMYDGQFLASQEGLVVVSINYRLGVLGFLAHPQLSEESPSHTSGNYGFLDQVEALRWVRRNISAFGGDPDNMTIAGESAGALSVMNLMASPMARGLFAKAIAQSSNISSAPRLTGAAHGHQSAEAAGKWLEQELGVGGIAAMRAIPAQDFFDRATQAGYAQGTTIDGQFFKRQIIETFEAGQQAHVPLLVGFNSGEMRSLRRLLPVAPEDAADYEAEIERRYGNLARRFLDLYPAASIEDSMMGATRDALFAWTAQVMARSQADIGQPSYLYEFDHGYPAADRQGLHAFHASEIPYVFGTWRQTAPAWPEIPDTQEERQLSSAIMQYWASFARTGKPSAEGHPDWPEFSAGKAAMVLRDRPMIAHDILGDRSDLMDTLVCRRRVDGQQPWNWNVGVASPPVPQAVPGCD